MTNLASISIRILSSLFEVLNGEENAQSVCSILTYALFSVCFSRTVVLPLSRKIATAYKTGTSHAASRPPARLPRQDLDK